MSVSSLKNDDFAQGMAHFCNGMGAFIVAILFFFSIEMPQTTQETITTLALSLLIISPHVALFFLICHYANAAFKNFLALIITTIITFLSLWLYTDVVFVHRSPENFSIFIYFPIFALGGSLSFMLAAELIEFVINRIFSRRK